MTHLQLPAEREEQTRAGHPTLRASAKADAANTEAANMAYEPVRLMNELTPPTHGSTQFVLSLGQACR